MASFVGISVSVALYYWPRGSTAAAAAWCSSDPSPADRPPRRPTSAVRSRARCSRACCMSTARVCSRRKEPAPALARTRVPSSCATRVSSTREHQQLRDEVVDHRGAWLCDRALGGPGSYLQPMVTSNVSPRLLDSGGSGNGCAARTASAQVTLMASSAGSSTTIACTTPARSSETRRLTSRRSVGLGWICRESCFASHRARIAPRTRIHQASSPKAWRVVLGISLQAQSMPPLQALW